MSLILDKTGKFPNYNLIGEKFGLWSVISWEGRGKSKSCGCMTNNLKSKHNMIHTPEYCAWSSMKNRCHNPNKDIYKNYGGRGIFVCRRWRKSFEKFYRDMGPRPSSKHSIDRINNNYGYIPFNCRWATQREQMNNTRVNRFISFRGETLTLFQWARKIGIDRSNIYNRINNLGWSIEKTLTTPVKKKNV